MKKTENTNEIETLKAALKRAQKKNEALEAKNKEQKRQLRNLKAKVERAASKKAKAEEVTESLSLQKQAEDELKKKGLWTDRVGDVLRLLFPDTDTQN